MAYHLLKDYDMALKILEEYRKTQMVRSVSLRFRYDSHVIMQQVRRKVTAYQ